tara:strand:+ start:868 stop:1530 length:663 start_codon:yes stop_codon:yes gene_type:complete
MTEINGNVFDMEKEQLKAALKAIAKQHKISASEVAKEAGVSPSTITGFLNDVPGRGHYGLSAKTQNKLSEKFPEFKEFIEKPPALEQAVQIPVIGIWGADYRVTGLELGMSNSFLTDWSKNIHLYSAVLRDSTFFIKNFNHDGDKNLIREIRYYLFQNKYCDDMDLLVGKQCYCSCDNGTYLGYIGARKKCFHLYDFYGKEIKSAGCIQKATKIEWTRQI